MTTRRVLLVARREVRLLCRSRAAVGAFVLLAVVAWLPVLLLPLRGGVLGLASFVELLPLQIALAAVVLPLLALLSGAELLAGEIEDGSLVPALTLPISRRACFAGKCAGRGLTLTLAYLVAFGSAGLAVMTTRGGEGAAGWAATVVGGLLLALSTGAIGAAIGAAGRGRVRAFGAALAIWVGLVFVLDAILLTVLVALAPPPPASVGAHGHGELAAPARARSVTQDPHAREGDPRGPAPGAAAGWMLAANPVGLFRLTALAAAPGPRLAVGLGIGGPVFWAALAMGWAAWLALPLGIGVRRFRRVDLG